MATNDPQQPKRGRQLDLQVAHILRKRVAFDDLSLEGEVGILPDRAVIMSARVLIVTPFSAGTLDIGEENTGPDALASALPLDAIAFLPFGGAEDIYHEQEQIVTFTRSADATAGEAIILIEYAVDN